MMKPATGWRKEEPVQVWPDGMRLWDWQCTGCYHHPQELTQTT
jgi:hypothetical protein